MRDVDWRLLGTRVWRWTLLIGGVIAFVVAGWFVYRELMVEHYRKALVKRGFHDSFARPLSRVQFEHPKWQFIPLKIDDLKWKDAVAKETTPGWNLVVHATWAAGEWGHLKEKNYTPYYAKDAKTYDSGTWYQASEAAIGYFMDPRNFLNERDLFMFETLGYDEDSQSLRAVEHTLSTTFMAGKNYDDGKESFAALVHRVGAKHGISPVFLAGRLMSEQSTGSVQAFGKIGDALAAYATNETGRVGSQVIWGRNYTKDNAATRKVLAKGRDAYNGYYNFFNFRAYGEGVFEIKYNAYLEALKTDPKYLGPWTTQARAIEGGAIKIKERYIDTKRHTRYLQKFSVLKEAGPYRWKQYMQNIAAPLVEARKTFSSYKKARVIDAPYRFLIPIYAEMPTEATPDPAGGRSVYSSSK